MPHRFEFGRALTFLGALALVPVMVACAETAKDQAAGPPGVPISYALTVSVNPAGSGTVSTVPSTADNRYAAGTTVILTPNCPTFVAWAGDLPAGANATTKTLPVAMDRSRAIVAVCEAGAPMAAQSPPPSPAQAAPTVTLPTVVAPSEVPVPAPTQAPVSQPVHRPAPAYLEYTSEVPPVASVTYRVPEGETVTVLAIRGWVSVVLLATVASDADLVGFMAERNGAIIVEANAKVGLYTFNIAPGKEGELIARLRQEPGVVEASPTFFLAPAQQPDKPVKVIDFPNRTLLDPVTDRVCRDFHGNFTALQITTAGGRAEIIDVRVRDKGGSPLATPWAFSVASKLLDAMEAGSAVNLSIGAPKSMTDPATGQETKLVGAAYRHWQGAFLATVFAVAERGVDVPVIVSAGNGDANRRGQDLTRYLEALRKQFPNAAKRVRIVEALDKDGRRAEWSNFSDVGSISAPGVRVPINSTGIPGAPIGVQECDGTSFSAPIVSGLMDGMKRAVTGKSAGDLWNTFEKVTRRQVPWTWEKANLPRQLLNEATGKRVLSVLLDPPSATVQQGKNVQFAAVLRDADGRLVTNLPASSFTWSTSNPAATVDGSGRVDGRAPGTAVVSVTVEGLRATATVTVTAPPPTFTGTWTGQYFATYSYEIGCTGSYTNSVRIEMTQTGSMVTGTLTWTTWARIGPPTCVPEGQSVTSQAANGSVSGDTVTLTVNYPSGSNYTWTMTRTPDGAATGRFSGNTGFNGRFDVTRVGGP